MVGKAEAISPVGSAIGIIPVVICWEKPAVVAEDNSGGSLLVVRDDDVAVDNDTIRISEAAVCDSGISIVVRGIISEVRKGAAIFTIGRRDDEDTGSISVRRSATVSEDAVCRSAVRGSASERAARS